MLDLRRATMRNVWIVAHREYMERIRTRGFLITTVMIPTIIAAFAFGSTFLASRANRNLRIAVVTADAQLAHDLQKELDLQVKASEQGSATALGKSAGSRFNQPENISLVVIEPATAA